MTTHRRPGNIFTQNGRLSQLLNYEEGIRAFFRPMLRRGVDVSEFRVNDRNLWDNYGVHASCTFKLGDDVLGNMDLSAGAFGIRISVYPENRGEPRTHDSYGVQRSPVFEKRWQKEYRKGRKVIKSARRPKFRKFGAYVICELFKRYQDYAVQTTMES